MTSTILSCEAKINFLKDQLFEKKCSSQSTTVEKRINYLSIFSTEKDIPSCCHMQSQSDKHSQNMQEKEKVIEVCQVADENTPFSWIL